MKHLFSLLLLLLCAQFAGAQGYAITLLEGVTAPTDGVWMSAAGLGNFSVHITGITTATVIVNDSNTPTKPANTVHHIELANVTADSLVHIKVPVRWVKVRVSAYTSGTIAAYGDGLR